MSQVVVLAGGLGTRLKPITEKIPKPLVEVGGKPFLEWQLMDLKRQGVKKVLLLIAYLGEQIQTYFGDGSRFGLEIEYCKEETPLGTGGAIKNALAQLEDYFVVINGDSFLPLDIEKWSKHFASTSFFAAMSYFQRLDEVPVPGNLKLDGEKVIAYKKGGGQQEGYLQVDSGVYFFRKSLFVSHPEDHFVIEDLWPSLIIKGQLGAFSVDQRFYDIGTPERLAEFEGVIRDYF